MPVSTALGEIFLAFVITNTAISACRFLKVKGSYMPVFTRSISVSCSFEIIDIKFRNTSIIKVDVAITRISDLIEEDFMYCFLGSNVYRIVSTSMGFCAAAATGKSYQ